jgi:DNA-binding NarL/FixJ family response regulator
MSMRGIGRWRGLPEPGTAEFERLVGRVRAHFPQLSARQAEVAVGVWGGLSECECAAWLGLSTDTVHGHFRVILERLGPMGITRRSDVIREVERKLNGSRGPKEEGNSASPVEGIP